MPCFICRYMRIVVAVPAMLLGSTLYSAPPEYDPAQRTWTTDEAAALKLSKETGAPVLVHFHATWCGPCKQMEANVFSTDEVRAKLRDSVIGVKIDSDRRPDLISRYNITGLPADVLLDSNGKEIGRSVGSVSQGEYLAFLGRVPLRPVVNVTEAPFSTTKKKTEPTKNEPTVPSKPSLPKVAKIPPVANIPSDVAPAGFVDPVIPTKTVPSHENPQAPSKQPSAPAVTAVPKVPQGVSPSSPRLPVRSPVQNPPRSFPAPESPETIVIQLTLTPVKSK